MLTKINISGPPEFALAASRLSAIAKSFVFARLFLILPLTIITISVLQPWIDPAWFFLDTLEAVRRSGDCCHVYQGLISNLGILLWAATSAICIFTAILLMVINRASIQEVILLFTGGILSGLLGLDDLFQVHEKILPFFGVSELITLLGYALILMLAIWSATHTTRIFDWSLFGLALGLFASSVLIDQVFHNPASIRVVIEDAAKFTGISSWFACFASSAFRSVLLHHDSNRITFRSDGASAQ